MKTTKTKTTKTTKLKVIKAVNTKFYQDHSPLFVTKTLHAKAKKLAKANGMTLTEWTIKNFSKVIKN